MVQAVIIGSARRRIFSEEQKRAIVAEAFAPGQSLSDFAFRNDIPPSSLYKWRSQYRNAPCPRSPEQPGTANFANTALKQPQTNGFSKVVQGPAVRDIAGADETLHGAIEVIIGGSQVRIPASIPVALAAAVISALVKA